MNSTGSINREIFRRAHLLVFQLLVLCFVSSAFAQLINPYGGSPTPAPTATDTSVIRGYIIPNAEPAPGGVKVVVDIFHMTQAEGVSLWLQAIINDGKSGQSVVLNLAQLSDRVVDNPNSYRSHREFTFTYEQLNKVLHAASPKLAHLQIGPGAALYVYAQWDSTGHQWGGASRGGVIFMPDDASSSGTGLSTTVQNQSAEVQRPDALDIAYYIPQTLANLFNDPTTGKGLKVDGQVRSRVEAEGKYQILAGDFENVRTALFRIAQSRAEAQRLFGDDWTFEVETRYMEKDAKGRFILDRKGFYKPSPMVDTYYDNANRDAAKHDVAIRYRWTENNGTGAWNFKPGLTVTNNEGVVYRAEYGLDTTDDKPETIAKFADSSHPLNFFQSLRGIVTGGKPSDFLIPSVKVTDYRYKFKLVHKDGLIIEFSLDDVHATDLRSVTDKIARFAQLEMDIDHLNVSSTNVVTQSNYGLIGSDPESVQAELEALTKKAFLEGRPVMHEMQDLDRDSPLFVRHRAEFELAAKAIMALRYQILDVNWIPGSQKYATSVTELGLLSPEESSPSVRSMLERKADVDAKRAQRTQRYPVGVRCADIF